jgi:hypothetical protein
MKNKYITGLVLGLSYLAMNSAFAQDTNFEVNKALLKADMQQIKADQAAGADHAKIKADKLKMKEDWKKMSPEERKMIKEARKKNKGQQMHALSTPATNSADAPQ